MSGITRQFIDFSTNTNNDTGENNAASIQPILDGEVVNAAVAGRPGENLRQRTEAIRDTMADTLYLRDADRGFMITGPRPAITWPGSTTTSHTGIPVISTSLWIMPMLTPGAPQVGAPPTASMFGTLHLKRSSDSQNSILVTSRRRNYAAGDQINVTVTSGLSFSCTLDAETRFNRTVKIVAVTGTTTLGAVISALNALVPPTPDNTQLVTAALENGAVNGDLLLIPQTRQYISGNYDGESHEISPSVLAGFFTSNPSQALAEGDTLCVSYATVSDTASTGGRRQSIPENSNTLLSSGQLFNSRSHPELLVNAIPICKVVNDDLVFPGGRTIRAGSTSVTLDGNDATGITYGGGGTWADGTTNPTTSVEAQLDKIISDLAGATGSAKIQGVANSDLAAGTVRQQLDNFAANWFKLSRNNSASGTQTFNNITATGALTWPRQQMAQQILLDRVLQSLAGSISLTGTDIEFGGQNGTDIPASRIYALSAGAAFLRQGSANHKVQVAPGTLIQKISNSDGINPTLIPYTFAGTEEFTLTNGDATNPRVDLLQVKFTYDSVTSVVTPTFGVKVGTPAASPTIPEPDAGFAPIGSVMVGNGWTTGGNAPIFGLDTAATNNAVVHDQRMPLGIKAHTVVPLAMELITAWALSSPSIAASSSATSELIAVCPTRVGRLVAISVTASVPLLTEHVSGQTLSRRSHGTPSSTVIAALNTIPDSTPSQVTDEESGFLVLEANHAPAAGPVIAQSVTTKIGVPIWTNGRRCPVESQRLSSAGARQTDRLIYRIVNTQNGTTLYEVTFWVAEGL